MSISNKSSLSSIAIDVTDEQLNMGSNVTDQTPGIRQTTLASSSKSQTQANDEVDPRRFWEKDSLSEGGRSSMDILIEWLTIPHNYARWKGGAGSGDSKCIIAQEIF